MKTLIKMIAALAVGLFLSTQVYAASPTHLDEALKHAEEAITQGKEGNIDMLKKQVKESLEHAMAAGESGEANAHINHGIKDMEHALKDADNGHINEATLRMQEALNHLRESGR